MLGIAILALLAGSAHLALTQSTKPWSVEVVQTTVNLSQRLTHLKSLQFTGTRPYGIPVIHVDARIRFQGIDGFGAAMTDTSAWLIWQELPSLQERAVMSDLFGPAGIGISFLRIPIGASDFTKDRRPYSYDDLPPGRTDGRLSHFSIAHDRAYVLPTLREALALNPRLSLLANPWSPPGWMKANGALDNQADTGTLLGSAYWTYARYIVKFLRAYAGAGVPIGAITPANEPQNPTRYPGMELDEPSEVQFIARDLVPALRQGRLSPHIYGHDAGWSPRSTAYAQSLASSSVASKLHGIAWHCYFGSPQVMTSEHNLDPRLVQIVDECSPGLTPSVSEVEIASLRNWASAVALWNLALDPRGGPVQPPNHGCPHCAGVVTVNERTHRFALNINYFQLGQASAFIKPGAQRIHGENFVSYNVAGTDPLIATAGLDDVALRNPDGSLVVLAYNNSTAPIRFAIEWRRRWVTHTLAPQATVTLAWNRPGG